MKRKPYFIIASLTFAIMTLITLTAVAAGVKYYPVAGTNITFGWRAYVGKGGHEGVDIFASPSTGIVAHRDGTVLYVYDSCDDEDLPLGSMCCNSSDKLAGYGNVIIIKHVVDSNTTYFTLYAHLKQYSKLVSVGQTVYAGQKIATMGKSGISGGKHLHFETRTGNYPTKLFKDITCHDPNGYLAGATKLAAPIPQPTYTVTYTANASGVTNMPASPKAKRNGYTFA